MKLRAQILACLNRHHRIPAAVLGGLSFLALAAPASAADLIEVYQRAVQNDPQIREADANRLASRESKPQALAALLPQINASGSYEHSQSDGSSVFPNTNILGEVEILNRDTETEIDTKAYQLQLRQTIFRWDQWQTLKRADAEVAQAEADYQAAQQDLIQRTAQRYFNVLAAQDTVDAAQATLEAFSRQLEQADKRFEVGLIAITDVQEARAAHDQAAAGVILAKRQLATALELLRELTGESFSSLSAPIDDMPLKSPDPENEETWVTTALEQNLRIISARLATDIAKQDVRVARSGHFPTIDLVAGRSGNDITGDQTITNPPIGPIPETRQTYPADRDGVDDSIGVQVTLPIYSGGATSSRVRQRVYLHRAARERLERANRETERAARDAYLGVMSEMSRVKALKQALESSKTALQATEAGFEVGTRTTVDVLDARRRLFEAQTNYSRSRYDYIINVLNLQLATGTLKQADLQEINSYLTERVITR
ncbi:MAG TPA: TolC family outer membrane protein [Povalibacter sp.]|uniref:TolC family outer membrane protein n=1 Tax=Povalibacter sp. TaxID=1962978 RepID=UPI002BB8D4FB|nr:TolC family outer membrane protein [Povalibacter sp.]HMN43681.1 TolC family outer membrane protein [Povalibacter sp.]